jgi:glycine/D-amino acid oxidase-like deaminating enzyme
METSSYDIAIVGSGPIGAATAYFLSRSGRRIALVSAEPLQGDPNREATYRYAGGSVRWFFDDPEIAETTRATADFIREKLAARIDLAAIEDSYVFIHRGLTAPSFNVSGAKLVEYLTHEAEKNGVVCHRSAALASYRKDGGQYVLATSEGDIVAKKVLLALGPALARFVPEAGFDFEKRQTFVLDLPVPPEREKFPHVVLPFHGGIVYLFIKRVGDDLKMLISQEGVVEENGEHAPDDYFKKMCDLGLTELMPFLKEAKTERVLWGFDAKNKTVKIYSPDHMLYAAACGSAVRGCIGIGKRIAAELVEG